MPSSWNWIAGSGMGDVGLTSTGGALGSRQTLYGNQLAGTLTAPVLTATITNAGQYALRYWAKRENSGSFTVTSKLILDGAEVASRLDWITTSVWTAYSLNYLATEADAGKHIQIRFVFSNGSGAWQGYLDEISLEAVQAPVPVAGFATPNEFLLETAPSGLVWVVLSKPSTHVVTVSHSLAGGTAVLGKDFLYSPGTLVFAPGSLSNSLPFSILDNVSYQGRKTILFRLSNSTNATLPELASHVVTLVDPEDSPPPSTYYVDAVSGNDANSGTNLAAPWKTLAKVNTFTFVPGDRLLLKTGGVWTGQLCPLGSGQVGRPITIDAYGSGPKPAINAGGIAGGAIQLSNQEYWSINRLQLSNYGATGVAKKQGILVQNDCVGTLRGISVRECDIHDVNGIMGNYADGKESGGIVFSVTASNTNLPSNWDDIQIENNTLRDVAREGILLQSLWVNKPQDPNTYWAGLGLYYPSTRVRIASNALERIGGDGIVLWATRDGLVESNFVRQANYNTPGQGHAGLWPYICENVIFQYNEVCETQTKYDGMAFDFDNSNQNCIYQFNYSHDNQGGFLNMCSGGNANGNIARYNISQNDGCLAGSRVFTIYGAGNQQYLVYNNTIYVSRNSPILFADDGGGSAASTIGFYNNIFINQGSGAVSSPAGCLFDYNLFAGQGYIASDAHRLVVDPQLLSPGSASTGLVSAVGYKLRTNSPAIGTGVRISNNGGRDYWGNPVSSAAPPNRGAYNFSGYPELPSIPTVGTNLSWTKLATNLVVSWPASYVGWQLLSQTNHLPQGIDAASQWWSVVPGSRSTNRLIIPLEVSNPACFYRLAAP